MTKKIWLSPPHMGGKEMKYIQDAFDSNWVAPLGPNVDNFEKEICHYLKVKHAAALMSGTAAIHLALIMLEVKQDDLIICQTFTFSGSANPIAYQKAIPVFVDSENETWNMDPDLLEDSIKKQLNKGKKPIAIILVHLYGQPAKLNEIMQIAEKYEIPVIEDAAEALGSAYYDKKVGAFGEIGILSFNGNKIITTSGGGMLLSNKEFYIQKARHLSTQARDDAPHYEHTEIGYNYRMSNILAGIGRGQLEVIEERIQQKRKIFDFYYKRLSKLPGITFQPELPHTFSNKWLTCIKIDPQQSGTDREKIRLHFERQNIDTRPLWKPMHLQPVFKNALKAENGVSEELFKNGLCLPSGTNLTENQLHVICEIIESHFDHI